ncbi:hypothetical protein BDN72DRAFT_925134 [Pluteus cervinus]|uniref:Uncharacterized protein n=1 Tax=Pluteus cervinus TaxID=181527 RepID=A0ACD3AHN9_9AGAR|nr:hypothetical protein BDN72DRAFT_925134 [Pluteus cervinus]
MERGLQRNVAITLSRQLCWHWRKHYHKNFVSRLTRGQVINDVDDDPAPPWEFHYSDQMWHTVTPLQVYWDWEVRPQNVKGACDERQKQQANGTIPNFAYDSKKWLKAFEYPIFDELFVRVEMMGWCNMGGW